MLLLVGLWERSLVVYTTHSENWGFTAVSQHHTTTTCISSVTRVRAVFFAWFFPSSHTFFIKSQRDIHRFSLHSRSMNSFGTTLSHQSLAPKISVLSLATFMAARFSCLAAERMALRILLCKSWQRVARKVQSSSFAERWEKRSGIRPYRLLYAAVIWICTQLHINCDNSGTFLFISHVNGLMEILSFSKQGKNWNICVHVNILIVHFTPDWFWQEFY